MVSQSKVDEFIKYWKSASKPELRQRIVSLKTKPKTASKEAEEKAIKALLS